MSQFVKNTDVPSEDSFLWQLADDWKISKKTGIPYATLERVSDEVLGTALTNMAETNKLDVVEYQSYFFVPANFNGKWSVYSFENEPEAKKKLDDTKRFASYDKSKTGGTTTTTVPKATATTTPKPAINTTKLSPGVIPAVLTAHDKINALESNNRIDALKIDRTITTFTDPTPVACDNKEQIATLRTDGYSFLPKSLVDKPFWEQPVFDDSEKQVGTQLIFLMGRIINVEIADNK